MLPSQWRLEQLQQGPVEQRNGGSSFLRSNTRACDYGIERRSMIRNPRNEHHYEAQDVPSSTPVGQSKVEFSQMTNRILLVLPPNPIIERTKATFETVISGLEKAIICERGPEATSKPHVVDFGERQTTEESFLCHSALEYRADPLAGEVGTATQLARGP